MKIVRILSLVALLILACGAARADISIYFSPSDSYQAIGSSFTIDILADIPDPGLVDFGFNLVWNQALMRLDTVGAGASPWAILWDSGTPEALTGFLFPTPTSPEFVTGTSILLASLDFTCLQAGTSGLDIALDPDLAALGLQGFYGPAQVGGISAPLAFTVTPGTVVQVPEPGSILLLAAAAGLALRAKRK